MAETVDVGVLTPVEKRGGYWLKRDDMFVVAGARGGKARSAWELLVQASSKGYTSVVTAGSRLSPQCEIVSSLCEHMGMDAHLFMPNGKDTSVITHINANKRSTIHRTKVGYNTVICHDAMAYAKEHGAFYIPFGMECAENIETTKHQVRNIPDAVKKIVVPCGSGMSMISIIKGLEHYGMYDKRVVGVVVGRNPKRTFERFLRNDLFERVNVEWGFEWSDAGYGEMARERMLEGVELDGVYEAKCLPFLQKGDLLWIVGKRM